MLSKIRIGPSHPWLGAAGFHVARVLSRLFLRTRGFHAPDSAFARKTLADIRARLTNGETVYICGVGAPGTHNTGVALVEVTQALGPRLILNNEEERFCGVKHATEYPRLSLADMAATLQKMGRGVGDIAAWVTSWDHPALIGMFARTVMDEAPASFRLLRTENFPALDTRQLETMTRTPKLIGRQLGLERRVPLIAVAHHDNHAWFSFAASPFDDSTEPVAIAVLDGMGDRGAISLYVSERGRMRQLSGNDSVFDSLGAFYGVISSTQGGWTWLSSEGRYMGAAAWGDNDRATNRYYPGLRAVLQLGPNGAVHLNRALANWQIDLTARPYSAALMEILGAPVPPDQLWNPDAMLRVEDIAHRPDTQDRLDKAAATQMVFEDALFHIVDHLLRVTHTHRLILTGGVALNAVANMRLLEHFDRAWFRAAQNRDATLHLWVPPTPGDPGVTIGAAWRFASLAGAPRGETMTHAFFCGSPPTNQSILSAVDAKDIASQTIGNVSTREGRDAIADLMALMVADGGIIALYQGAAETGPRALGHRSIFANPCDPQTRERLNARVKYREAIRPLAPMATLAAAHAHFELQDGGSDADYNAYNYMVLTARAKPHALQLIPAVIHADGTGRVQIVREADDPLTHAYLVALGRRIGVEMSVNTSFNVAGPIAQTPSQAIDTLRRATGLDVVIMVAASGEVHAVWHGGERDNGRFTGWLREWRSN